jgi:hypothetical protein
MMPAKRLVLAGLGPLKDDLRITGLALKHGGPGSLLHFVHKTYKRNRLLGAELSAGPIGPYTLNRSQIPDSAVLTAVYFSYLRR